VATANTGRLLEERTGLVLADRVASGPLGGDQQIGAMIATGLVEAVLFFKDPLRPLAHQADVDALLRLCDVYGILVGTNAATCAAIVQGLAYAGRRSVLTAAENVAIDWPFQELPGGAELLRCA
jgi:methylglyoxal synthase